ncbi:ESX secretion-associated protein EspG [Saccharopolyspora taberi]|uniref:ESX secretion-associated protein EspG n=1 Tax=Saccharopolyspora taberi TaxID=60895 RepID=UPI0031D89B6D
MPSKIDIDLLEFAVLADRSGINRVPAVASYSNYATPFHNIPVQLAEAEQRCRQRGLLTPGGEINDRVRELIGIYPHVSLEYDLRFSAQKGTELRACVSQAGETAVRTIVEGDHVVLDKVRPVDMIPALIAVLPELQPARIRPPLSIDLTEMRAAMADVSKHGRSDNEAIEQALRSRGADVRPLRQMTQLLDGPRQGLGEIGVTVWDPRRKEHRGDQTIRIIDLESGRTAVYNSGNQRMFAGADTSTFTRVLGEIATETRRDVIW